MYKKLILKKGKEVTLLRKHRWVFSGALQADQEYPDDGEIVQVSDHKGNHLGQPPDHPVNVFHPETEYLKGLVLYVD